jgi:hypothetical protein
VLCTERGVQVDSSVAHLIEASIAAVSWAYDWSSMAIVGRHWSASDALGTP